MDHNDISPEAMRRVAQAQPQVLYCEGCTRPTAHEMTGPEPRCGFCGTAYQDQGGKCQYCPSGGGYCPVCAPYTD